MATVPCQPFKRLRHERRAQPVLLSNRFHHELEERVLVGGCQHIIEIKVHLELTIRVLMVVLIRAPAHFAHVIADLSNHVVAAHDGLLVVARLVRRIVFIRNGGPVRRGQKILRLNPGFHTQASICSSLDQTFQRDTRRLLNRLPFHHAITCDPGDLWFPWKLDDRPRVRHRQHIRIGRRHVEVASEPSEPSAFDLHVCNRGGWHQFGALCAEEIRKANRKILYAVLFRPCGQIFRHLHSPVGFGFAFRGVISKLTRSSQ